MTTFSHVPLLIRSRSWIPANSIARLLHVVDVLERVIAPPNRRTLSMTRYISSLLALGVFSVAVIAAPLPVASIIRSDVVIPQDSNSAVAQIGQIIEIKIKKPVENEHVGILKVVVKGNALLPKWEIREKGYRPGPGYQSDSPSNYISIYVKTKEAGKATVKVMRVVVDNRSSKDSDIDYREYLIEVK